jgi:rod shape determining protein RodA
LKYKSSFCSFVNWDVSIEKPSGPVKRIRRILACEGRSQFGRILALGLTTMFFLYIFINVAMVMGLVPVVGVPLPLISYGGTAMITVLIGFGMVLGVYVHRDVIIGRRGGLDGL